MKQDVVINLCTALLNVCGDLLLVPRIGPLGAAISTSGAIAIHAILHVWVCQKQLQRKFLWHLILVLPALWSIMASQLLSGCESFFLAMGGTLAIGYGLARAFHLFRYEDLVLLDYIQMPQWLRKAICRMYR